MTKILGILPYAKSILFEVVFCLKITIGLMLVYKYIKKLAFSVFGCFMGNVLCNVLRCYAIHGGF